MRMFLTSPSAFNRSTRFGFGPHNFRCWIWILCLQSVGLVGVLHGQFQGQRTYCNPVDINYQYNFEQKARGISFRSGADPVIVQHRGEYYLFVTISGGWWRSKDLVNWSFVKPDVSPLQWAAVAAALLRMIKLYRCICAQGYEKV